MYRERHKKTTVKRRTAMTDTHCPGFESNKTLKEVKVRCPVCKKEWEVFSDELEKTVKCQQCGGLMELKKNTVE
jgi:uncharacterized protein (DUF983 family)